MFENLAFKFGELVKKKLNISSDEAEIIAYGAINLLQTVNSILWIIIAGLFTKSVYETLLFSTTASILRKYSGGVHASSPMRCTIIGTVTSTFIGIFISRIFYMSNINIVIGFCIFSLITSFIIIIKNAPVDSIEKPIDDDSKIIFKRKSIILILIITLVIIILFFMNIEHHSDIYIKSMESIAMGILWQSITLIRIGISLIRKIDLGLKYITEWR